MKATKQALVAGVLNFGCPRCKEEKRDWESWQLYRDFIGCGTCWEEYGKLVSLPEESLLEHFKTDQVVRYCQLAAERRDFEFNHEVIKRAFDYTCQYCDKRKLRWKIWSIGAKFAGCESCWNKAGRPQSPPLDFDMLIDEAVELLLKLRRERETYRRA